MAAGFPHLTLGPLDRGEQRRLAYPNKGLTLPTRHMLVVTACKGKKTLTLKAQI
jgi:hypothetical protein